MPDSEDPFPSNFILFYGVRVLWGPWPLYTLVTGRNLGQNQANVVVVGLLPLIQRDLSEI